MLLLFLIGDHHEYAEVALDLFHLSEEDVHTFVTDDKLRKALVPVDNLYITGELGQGIKNTRHNIIHLVPRIPESVIFST